MNRFTYQCSEDDLRNITVESTKTYTAIPYKSLIDKVKECVDKQGLTILEETYTSCNNHKIANGLYRLNMSDSDIALELFWQNSIDKTVSFKIAAGSYVFVCTNGCVYGDIGAYRKIHKGDADIQSVNHIESYIKSSKDYFSLMVEQKNNFKELQIDNKKRAMIIGDLFLNSKILTSTQLSIVADEIAKPSFEYNAKDSLWELYQHCTHSFKIISPRNFIMKQIELNNYFENVSTEL